MIAVIWPFFLLGGFMILGAILCIGAVMHSAGCDAAVAHYYANQPEDDLNAAGCNTPKLMNQLTKQ